MWIHWNLKLKYRKHIFKFNFSVTIIIIFTILKKLNGLKQIGLHDHAYAVYVFLGNITVFTV